MITNIIMLLCIVVEWSNGLGRSFVFSDMLISYDVCIQSVIKFNLPFRYHMSLKSLLGYSMPSVRKFLHVRLRFPPNLGRRGHETLLNTKGQPLKVGRCGDIIG